MVGFNGYFGPSHHQLESIYGAGADCASSVAVNETLMNRCRSAGLLAPCSLSGPPDGKLQKLRRNNRYSRYASTLVSFVASVLTPVQEECVVMHIKYAWAGLGLLLLAGCYAPVRPDIDKLVCDSANLLVDQRGPEKTPANGKPSTDPRRSGLAGTEESEQPYGLPRQRRMGTLEKTLEVPLDIQGSEAKALTMPNPNDFKDKKDWLAEVEKAVSQYLPPLPDVGKEPNIAAALGPDGRPLTLADLQKLARANSPILRQAAAAVLAAQGAMIQAGLYANPTFGIQGSTAGPSGGPSFGPFIAQNISTMGKLKLAQAAATMDLENAKLAYKKAESDLAGNVRSGYFAVLSAEENIRQNRALVALTDAVYKVLVQQAKGGEFTAGYEPMQVGVFANQARLALIVARNSYIQNWTQLAATLGLTGMPPTQLAGRLRDMPLPNYRRDTALMHVLNNHTSVLTANNDILKARYLLRLAEVTAVPDFSVQGSLTNDETPSGPNRLLVGMSVSVPIPVWNLNQGSVQQAKAMLVSANEEPHAARTALASSMADAYRRYLENQQLLDMYRKEILPKQVSAFRAAVKRHYGGEVGGVAYMDLVNSEQNLVTVIGAYLPVVQAQWQAVSDLATLLQTDDIYQLAEGQQFAQPPDLEELLPLACCHPCSPLQDPAFKGAHLEFPPTGFPPASRGRLASPVSDTGATLSTPAAYLPEAGPMLDGTKVGD
jgi:cobalt-zinc-cadmium efflux system outer membrane protein